MIFLPIVCQLQPVIIRLDFHPLHGKDRSQMDIPIPEFSRKQIPRFPHEKELRSMAAMGMPVPFTRGEKIILTGLRAIREAIEAQKNEPEKVEPEKVYFTLEEAAEYLRLTDRQLKDLTTLKAARP